ncbi:threonine/homoserine/homoserine lactone efflux protein [Litoreibacter halocynthiae]|uniref:Threonine/homoserine/homoserine lactone efflux protein n=1 Tax=Litoreibacter halocynthiae TaxID=1242689 RepID=A0A4R7LPQ6_9RHOB|nr:LysE family transporter [Litoreibacter halocynthiae]TDT77764.1 threonine/homoserine/homoserine lactone efflux protein [Litoreibacter halocynthiae]
MTLAGFVSVALIHLLAAISPGPSFVLSVRSAASEGLRTAMGLAVGFGLAATLWAAAALLGLSLLFEVVPALFTALKVVGGLFLIYIAWKMWQHASEPLPVIAEGTAPRSVVGAVWLGLVAMLANPKPAVFFGAVFVGLVPVEASLADKLFVLFNIFWVETAWYMIVARVFSLPRARTAYSRFKSKLDRSFGGLIAALGAKIAIT